MHAYDHSALGHLELCLEVRSMGMYVKQQKSTDVGLEPTTFRLEV